MTTIENMPRYLHYSVKKKMVINWMVKERFFAKGNLKLRKIISDDMSCGLINMYILSKWGHKQHKRNESRLNCVTLKKLQLKNCFFVSARDVSKADRFSEYLADWVPNLFLNVLGGKSVPMKSNWQIPSWNSKHTLTPPSACKTPRGANRNFSTSARD